MKKSLDYNILAELCHLLWIALRAVHVAEVNWAVNNNHTESLRWWRRNRKGENNRLATVGTRLGCLNISAAGWGTLCHRVCPQQVSRCPSLLLFFPCNCLDLCFTKDQNIVQIFMWGAVWSENLSIWLKRFLAGSEKVQEKAVIVHL